MLTRTIKKINLSHFLHNSFCFLDSLLLRTKPTAQLLFLIPVQGDSILTHHQHCTATLKELIRLVPGLAKSAPCFAHCGLRKRLPRFQDTAFRPSFDSATFTIFYCRAVRVSNNLSCLLIIRNLSFYQSALFFVP